MTEKTVLITGCESGVGRAAAYAFLEEEWAVYATARNPADVEKLGEAGCDISKLDVTDPEDVERVVGRTIHETGRIDGLVNAAGFGQYGPLEDVDDDRLERQFDANLFGPHRMIRAVLPHMRDREGGTIVNLSSIVGRFGAPGIGAFAASKHALEGYSDSLRPEVEGFGIDVSVVQSGPVKSGTEEPSHAEIGRLDRTDAYEDLYAFIEDASLFGGESPIAVHPAEIAEAVVEATVTPDPEPRYVVGATAQLAIYASYLPAPIRDQVFETIRRVSS